MKTKTRLRLMTLALAFILNFSGVYGQNGEIESIIISITVEGVYYNKYTIETIKPDYSIEVKAYTAKDNVNVILKKELDIWLQQGYQIKESNSSNIAGGYPVTKYILVRE